MISRILLALLIYILVLSLLYYLKPSMMFDVNGNVKRYNENDSLLTIEIIAPILALLCYILVLIISLFKN